ncbi:hypothetical protein TWF694_009745 [Orbilia ellipsospora]|uniref:F-box domain-containing protein n=1 Tax=Orbilia ellipsospora TaxID=2528407 RepID=A0AAV9XBS0_9PEZI
MRFESSNVQLAAAEKLQAEGMASLRKGNYKLAIDKFTEAIDMQPPILMTLLDGRAALYDKIDQLKLALKDAKRMMEHEKANPKGYLRAGKVLYRMNKPTMALEIYKLGVKNVEPSDPHLPRLQEMIEKAVDKQTKALKAAQKKIYDPMQVLPLELLEMVLEYLPFANIVAMQRVSKTWRGVISNNPRFWTTLDFSRAKKPVSRAALKNCISKSKYTLTKAILKKIHNFNDTTLIDMVSVCKDLEYLKVMGGFMGSSLSRAMQLTKSMRTLILHCQIPFATFEALVNPELPLEHLECLELGPTKGTMRFGKREPCLALKRLLVNFANEQLNMRPVALDELLVMLPNVQELQLNKLQSDLEKLDMTSLEQLEIFVCRNSKIQADEVVYPVSLQILDLSCTSFTSAENIAEHQETLLNLKRLNLTKCNLTPTIFLELVPPFETQLTHLRIGYARHLDYNLLAENFFRKKLLTELRELSVEGDYDFSNHAIKELYYQQNLERLNFSITSLNGSGAYQFILNSKSVGNIREIYMNGIDRVSADLVQFAAKKGIRIIQMQENGRDWLMLRGENEDAFMRV